ncbi:MAG: hypothetical protein FWF59_03150 [Turicibacter sp.]|nr:hypothetical protein [Turicibacter sp.]
MFADIFSYDNELRYEGEKRGEQKGKLEGKQEEQFKIVSKLLKKGYDTKTIMELTEISDHRLEEIKAQLKK